MSRDYYPDRTEKKQNLKSVGLSHVVFGQGVGKTSRCVGLAVRAAGAGLKVVWVQFMKSPGSSETKVFERLPEISYLNPGEHPFILKDGPKGVHLDHAGRALEMAYNAIERGAQVIITDEILNTLIFGTLKVKQVLELMDACRGKAELVMSGADAPMEIQSNADYVTELRQIKHPYYLGQEARKGIEL